jgi:hypothetical protein
LKCDRVGIHDRVVLSVEDAAREDGLSIRPRKRICAVQAKQGIDKLEARLLRVDDMCIEIQEGDRIVIKLHAGVDVEIIGHCPRRKEWSDWKIGMNTTKLHENGPMVVYDEANAIIPA